MCGISGVFAGGEGFPIQDLSARMSQALKHRGPDSEGLWTDEDAGVSLAHRRLAILDPSPNGHQPMVSKCGRWVISFNGEIYNHLALRREIADTTSSIINWDGSCDTETLLFAIGLWGLPQTLNKLVGMFAFSLWDRKTNRLHLIRDRIGEKPLYFQLEKGILCFSSELNSLGMSKSERKISHAGVFEYLMRGYVRAPKTIFENCHELLPGTYVVFDSKMLIRGAIPEPIPYWSASKLIHNDMSSQNKDLSLKLAASFVEGKIKDAVNSQLLSDAPLGTFLSGGIDSSLITALARDSIGPSLETFSLGFAKTENDDSFWAKKISRHIDTIHTEVQISNHEILEAAQKIPSTWGQPFADTSQLPTLVLSKVASSRVKVVLTGDGADEIFGGYSRYRDIPRRWEKVNSIPLPLRSLFSKTLGAISDWPPSLTRSGPIRKLAKSSIRALEQFSSQRPSELNESVLNYQNPRFLLRDKRIPFQPRDFLDSMELPTEVPFGLALMLQDMIDFLPNDILTKVDRSAMAYGLETRAPFLDHRVIESAWSVNPDFLLPTDVGKRLLRQILRSRFPENFFLRPKRGFSPPIKDWLRGPLRPLAEELLSTTHTNKSDIFDSEVVQKLWKGFLDGNDDVGFWVWRVFVFEQWAQEHRRKPACVGDSNA